MSLKALEYKSPNFKKLTEFGFEYLNGRYSYKTTVLDGQFEMRVEVYENGEVITAMTDAATNEPYTLHLVADAQGSFVGAVRAEHERVVGEIAEKCFEKDVFKSDGAHKVIEYARKQYGDELQYLWKTFPSNAVLRRKDNDKWYAALLIISKNKLGLSSNEIVDVIDLRIQPDELVKIKDDKKYFAGYHMNKKSWLTICLDGSVPVEEICKRLDKSYELAQKAK